MKLLILIASCIIMGCASHFPPPPSSNLQPLVCDNARVGETDGYGNYCRIVNTAEFGPIPEWVYEGGEVKK
jgi:hypothetical protein